MVWLKAVQYAYQGAQLAAPEFCCATTVFVPCCVLTLPVGVVLPAKEKSMTPINSAIRAYMNFASLNLFDGVCSSPGIFAQKLMPLKRQSRAACAVCQATWCSAEQKSGTQCLAG